LRKRAAARAGKEGSFIAIVSRGKKVRQRRPGGGKKRALSLSPGKLGPNGKKEPSGRKEKNATE